MKIRRVSHIPLTIGNGVIEYSNTILPINNITKIGCGKLPVKTPFIKMALTLIISLGALKLPGAFAAIGVVIILSLIAYGFYLYWLNSFSSLNFQLASSEIVFFDSQDKSFLEACYSKVKDIIENDKKGTSYNFDFTNSKINDSTIQISKRDINNIKDVNNSVVGASFTNSPINISGGNRDIHNSTIESGNTNQSITNDSSINIDEVIDSFNSIKSQISDENDLKKIDEIIDALNKKDTNKAKQVFLTLTDVTYKLTSVVSVISKLFTGN